MSNDGMVQFPIFDLSICRNFASSPSDFLNTMIFGVNSNVREEKLEGRAPENPIRQSSPSIVAAQTTGKMPVCPTAKTAVLGTVIRSAGRRRDRFLRRGAPGNSKRRMQRPQATE